jgi:CheY-like chemotaxis protein
MPVLDGLAATRVIRQRELEGEGLLGVAMTTRSRTVRLPIIAVTANVREEQVKLALEAGAVCFPLICVTDDILIRVQDDVVQKPFKVMDLMDKLRSLLV